MIRRGPDLESGVQVEGGAAADKQMPNHLGRLPFAQRLTCTVAEACEVTGLGRTKLYELIGDGRVTTTIRPGTLARIEPTLPARFERQ